MLLKLLTRVSNNLKVVGSNPTFKNFFLGFFPPFIVTSSLRNYSEK